MESSKLHQSNTLKMNFTDSRKNKYQFILTQYPISINLKNYQIIVGHGY